MSLPLRPEELFRPQRIVSGGQTGVDRGGLEAAIALGIDQGGWCPAGRIAEDGPIPARYALVETESREYPVRTRQNVIDSDATLILYERRISGGTLLTQRICRTSGKPWLAARIDRHRDGVRTGSGSGSIASNGVNASNGDASGLGVNDAEVARVRVWLDGVRPSVLNVAGPRESNFPGIEQRSRDFLRTVLSD